LEIFIEAPKGRMMHRINLGRSGDMRKRGASGHLWSTAANSGTSLLLRRTLLDGRSSRLSDGHHGGDLRRSPPMMGSALEAEVV
jgi:hypothetical protein